MSIGLIAAIAALGFGCGALLAHIGSARQRKSEIALAEIVARRKAVEEYKADVEHQKRWKAKNREDYENAVKRWLDTPVYVGVCECPVCRKRAEHDTTMQCGRGPDYQYTYALRYGSFLYRTCARCGLRWTQRPKADHYAPKLSAYE